MSDGCRRNYIRLCVAISRVGATFGVVFLGCLGRLRFGRFVAAPRANSQRTCSRRFSTLSSALAVPDEMGASGEPGRDRPVAIQSRPVRRTTLIGVN